MNRQWSVVSSQWSVAGGIFATDNGQQTMDRTGISLMEVLISIGIMAIGMVSIASLLPVGGMQVQRANVEERKAELGLNAYREFQIRGMANPKNWLRYNPTGPNWVNYLATTPAAVDIRSSNNYKDYPPVAIDPFMVSVGRRESKEANIDRFPANALAAWPTMKRVTLSSIYNATPATERALAESVMVLNNELVVDQPEDRTLPGTAHMALDSGNLPLKRDFEGNYSWIATLAPQYGDTSTPAAMNQYMQSILPAAMNQYTLSIVVFDRRRATTPAALSGQEEMVGVMAPSGATTNIGGGDMTLVVSRTSDIAKFDLVRPGNWLMLCRYFGPLQTPPLNTPRIAKWYRIISASEGSSSTNLNVTLAGPDWTWDPSNQNFACLFDGAVAVYERSIHLEDPSSIWNQ